MIGHISGTIIFSDGYEVIILPHSGVGHQVHYNTILPEGEKTSLYISHIVREDAEELYGFKNFREKKLFEMLMKVRGIGPKSAFSLIGTVGVKQICDAITYDNKKILTTAPGVGPKAASQIILDLGNKIHRINMYSEKYGQRLTDNSDGDQQGIKIASLDKENSRSREESEEGSSIRKAELINDALMACKELGFQERKIIPLLHKVMSENKLQRAEQLVHLVLKEI